VDHSVNYAAYDIMKQRAYEENGSLLAFLALLIFNVQYEMLVF